MLHLYSGQDEFRLREAFLELRDGLDTDGMLETNTAVLAPRGLTPGLLLQHVTTVPFLAGARLVVVEGLVRSLGGGRNVVAEWQPLLDVLPDVPPTNHLVLLEQYTDRDQRSSAERSALLRALQAVPGADVRAFPELRTYNDRGPSEVARWVEARARSRGTGIEGNAIEAMVGLLGSDLRALDGELTKLSVYTGQRRITLEDVQLLTPEAEQDIIFQIVDAVVEGRGAEGLTLTHRLLQFGTWEPPRVQSMIARQVRNLVRAAELIEANAGQDAVASATGTRNGFPLNKLLRQARATSRGNIEAALRAVEESDHAWKTGQLDDGLALDLLIVELSALFRRPGAQRRRAARR